jgi:hypothetical protein
MSSKSSSLFLSGKATACQKRSQGWEFQYGALFKAYISSLSVFPSQEITLVYSILLARRVSWFLSYYVDGIHFLIRTLMLMKLLMCA